MSDILGCYQQADRRKLAYVVIDRIVPRDLEAGTVWSRKDTVAENLLSGHWELT